MYVHVKLRLEVVIYASSCSSPPLSFAIYVSRRVFPDNYSTVRACRHPEIDRFGANAQLVIGAAWARPKRTVIAAR